MFAGTLKQLLNAIKLVSVHPAIGNVGSGQGRSEFETDSVAVTAKQEQRRYVENFK
jgi:hypothetical protein